MQLNYEVDIKKQVIICEFEIVEQEVLAWNMAGISAGTKPTEPAQMIEGKDEPIKYIEVFQVRLMSLLMEHGLALHAAVNKVKNGGKLSPYPQWTFHTVQSYNVVKTQIVIPID